MRKFWKFRRGAGGGGGHFVGPIWKNKGGGGGGGGGYILWVDFGKSRGEAGSYGRSPPLGWYGYFLEPLDFA